MDLPKDAVTDAELERFEAASDRFYWSLDGPSRSRGGFRRVAEQYAALADLAPFE